VGGATPEELETLLEDAFVLRDAPAVADLFEPRGLLVAGLGRPAVRGAAAVGHAAAHLWALGYVADPRAVLQVPGLALVVGARSATVARRGVDGVWRYAFAVFADS